MNAPAHVRTATEEDLGAMLHIQQTCHEAPQWSAVHYRDALCANPLAGRLRGVFVIEISNTIMGYAVVSAAMDEAELESVAVLPEARRQGLARALCQTTLAWAAGEGAKEVWLEVRSASEGAQALYRHLGFVPMGVRKRYYADPEDDAVLMRANLCEGSHL